jgi:soluble lytic murein transglycosylase-like protein
VLIPIFLVLAGTSFFAAAAGAAQARPRSRVVPAKLTSEIVAIAKKWAKLRGLPAHLVLATIQVESRGNPRALRSTAREASYGLMQVNWRAHGERLAKAGVTSEMLYDPATNIEWGTLILKEAQAKATKAGAAPIHVATRHVYKGFSPHTRDPETLFNWNEALAQTRALV